MRGARVAYSAAELAFIEYHSDRSRVALHAAFVRTFIRADVTVDNIKSLCTRMGWTKRRRWSDDDNDLLRTLYPDTPTEEIARRLGRTLSATYGHAQQLGLEKSQAYLDSPAACRLRRGDNVGAAHRFPKGNVPANKGLRRPGWSPGRMASTQFAPGQSGWNWKPIGSERVVDGYRYTKISDQRRVPWTRNWKPTHVLRWEALNGPLPKGMALKSLDGNRLNVDPANWTAVPRAMLPRLNGKSGRDYDKAPAALKPAIMAIAKLEHVAKERAS